MIKLKLSDSQDIKSFSGLIHSKDILLDYSIELVEGGSYDYELISSSEFLFTNLPFKESIEKGIDNISKKSGDYFLVHGGDSTSIAGVWEVFKNSNAKYLFKKQILTRKKYSEKSQIGKWFFGEGNILNLSYDLSEDDYSKLKLTGYNVGHNWKHLQNLYTLGEKDIDVAAIYQTHIPRVVHDHELRTDSLYTSHRKYAWDILETLPYKSVAQQIHPQQTSQILNRSKVSISPFGMGELCYRDLESIQHGCIIIKPSMDDVITEPNLFIPYETYIPCKLDYSDLPEILNDIIGNYNKYRHIIENSRNRLQDTYSYQNVCLHWYNFFSNMAGVKTEDV